MKEELASGETFVSYYKKWILANCGPLGKIGHAPPFSPAEIEAAKTHGTDRYAKQAMVVAEWHRVEAARAWKKENGPLRHWITDFDDLGVQNTAGKVSLKEDIEWRRSWTVPLPGEGPGDWAQKNGWMARVFWDRHGEGAAWERGVEAAMEQARSGYWFEVPL